MGRLLSICVAAACLGVSAEAVLAVDIPPGVPLYPSDAFDGPLVGEYHLRQTSWIFGREEDPSLGTYHIASKYLGAVVKDVTKMAARGNYVVGMDGAAYFVIDGSIDTSRDSPANVDAVRRFPDAAAWRAALVAVGVPPDVALEPPEVVASRVPRTVGFPADYRRLHNLGGLSDPDWAGDGMLVVLLAMVALGGIGGDRVKLLVPALVAGLVAAMWFEFLVPGDLGGPCAYLLSFPILCLLAGWLGKVGGRAVRSVRRRRAAGAPTNGTPADRPAVP